MSRENQAYCFEGLWQRICRFVNGISELFHSQPSLLSNDIAAANTFRKHQEILQGSGRSL